MNFLKWGGVNALDEEAKLRYKKSFVELSAKQKDEVLRAFEQEKQRFLLGIR
ncbi:TPA: gluconate 2-dehydrogenase subunit 3 family protein [Campylobacter jejuni]|nr:gluconate 2-dehydrogenase subunit 3 family protein [Campylobacter jejuni]